MAEIAVFPVRGFALFSGFGSAEARTPDLGGGQESGAERKVDEI